MSAAQTGAEAGAKFVGKLLDRLGFEVQASAGPVGEAGVAIIRLAGDVADLQAERDLLASVVLLAGQVCSKAAGDRLRVVLDVGGSLDRRTALLSAVAEDVARAVSRTGRRAVLEGLDAAERRVVHSALVEDARVRTRSEGDDENRLLLVEAATTRAR